MRSGLRFMALCLTLGLSMGMLLARVCSGGVRVYAIYDEDGHLVSTMVCPDEPGNGYEAGPAAWVRFNGHRNLR